MFPGFNSACKYPTFYRADKNIKNSLFHKNKEIVAANNNEFNIYIL